MAGVRLSPGASVIWFGAVDPAGPGAPVVVTAAGTPVGLPAADGRRDGSGVRVRHPLASLGGAVSPA